MRVFVTGANGQFGSECEEEAERRVHEEFGFCCDELDITD